MSCATSVGLRKFRKRRNKMVLILCVIIILWCLDGLCSESDRKRERSLDNKRAEKRHDELVKTIKGRKKVTRTFACDEYGKVILQETVEGYKED